MTISPRIGIAGITGRLGSLCAEEAGTSLVGGLSRHADESRNITSSPTRLAEGCDVVIDVSHGSTVQVHAKAFTDAKCPWVLGTTGLGADGQAAVMEASKHIPVLQAANFSPALTLFLELAKQLGAGLPGYDAEIVEVHHRQKVDAPSGTALAIGRAVAEGRSIALEDVIRLDQNGARPEGAIGFASLRGGQIVGEHDLMFMAADEQITLSHRALDRRVFARGAIMAAQWLVQQPPGLYGMADVLRRAV